MNFYLDFEATQFSNQIISIGCVAENGKTFYTLVNPGKKEKLSIFIIELTGITEDMLKTAPNIDNAFYQLQTFVLNNNLFTGEPCYFCYGDNDAEFIKQSIKHMRNTNNIIFAQSILYALFDYSKSVKKFFNTNQAIALHKLFSFMQTEEIIQKHNALEDAQMLKDVANQLYKFCDPTDIEEIRNIPRQKKPTVSKKQCKAPESFLNLQGSTWKCDTGNVNDYKIKCYTEKGRVKYFKNMEIAVMWLTKYICGGSPKNKKRIDNRAKKIKNAIKTEKKYCGMFWKGNKND